MPGADEIIDFNNLTFRQARDLENCMKEMRQEYNELIADVSKKQTIGPLWWITSVSSRNIIQSPLFTRCAQLYMLSGYLNSGVPVGHIISPDKIMAEVIAEYKRRNNLGFTVTYPKKNLLQSLRHAASFFYYPVISIFKWVRLYLTLFRKVRTDLSMHEEITLIDMFALDNTISETRYSERYFNSLLDYLSDDEKRSIYMFPVSLFSPKNSREKYKAMVKIENPKFLPFEQYLGLGDCFAAHFFANKYFRHRYGKTLFKGFRIEKLLRNEAHYAFRDDTILCYLRYKSIMRLSETGIKVRHLLDWYEGQPLDRATLFAFNKFFPDTDTIAFCGGHIGNITLQQQVVPTAHEQAAGMTAKTMAVMGEGMVKAMHSINHNLKITVAPALRYKELWDCNNYIGERIIVALSYFDGINATIINSLLEAIEKNKSFQKHKIIMKQHPACNRKYDFSRYAYISFSDDAFPKLLEDCAVMITGAATTTTMETMARGIPVIAMANPNDVNVTYIPDSITKDIWELCYTAGDLAAALDRFLNICDAKKTELKEIGNHVREQYFERTTRENARDLLGLR